MGACFGVPVLAGRLAPLRFAAARCQDGHAYAPTRLATLGAPSVWCSGLGTSLRRSLTYGLPTSNPQAHQESLVRAAIASLTSFVGYRPHPQKSPPKINGKVTPPFGRWRLLPPPRSLRGSKQQSSDGGAAKPQRISCGDGAWACFLRSPAPSAPYGRRLRVASSLGGWRRYRRRPCSLRRRASALR